jgi:hypothetical protein
MWMVIQRKANEPIGLDAAGAEKNTKSDAVRDPKTGKDGSTIADGKRSDGQRVEVREIKERDIQILWSRDGTKCAVAIWGRMRGVIDLANNRQVAAPMNNPASPAIADPDWLRSFDKYMDQEKFIRARQRFWKEKVKEYDPDALPRPEDETPIETNFIVFDKALDDLFAVFEDDGDTGYLYVFAVADQQIRQRVQIYDKAKILNVVPEDVRVVWSADGAKCGVIIWNKMRGIIDRVKNQEGRVKLDGRESPGIGDKEWLKGFDLFRESDHSIQ